MKTTRADKIAFRHMQDFSDFEDHLKLSNKLKVARQLSYWTMMGLLLILCLRLIVRPDTFLLPESIFYYNKFIVSYILVKLFQAYVTIDLMCTWYNTGWRGCFDIFKQAHIYIRRYPNRLPQSK